MTFSAPGKIAPPSRTVAEPLARTMRLKRAHFASGGSGSSTVAPYADASDLAELLHTGPIKSQVKGRTDHIPISVPSGAYVIPADVVSGMGQGNSDAGHVALAQRFNLTPGRTSYARGGGVKIMAAGGEHVIDPADVRKRGRGNLDKGHEFFDKFVVEERKKIVKTLRKLPGPKKSD